MALGSSAPEILLSVIETVKNLGACPGELGPSTIVGSAAFNLLVISAVSVYSVDESNDTDKDKPANMKGIKKINDMGVFSITAIFSVLSYIWLFIVLSDQKVEVWEAVTTFCLFFVLVIFSFAADKYNSRKEQKEGLSLVDQEPFIEYDALEIQRELIKEQEGHSTNDPEKRVKMKAYLK